MFQKCVSKSESRQPLDKNDDDVTDFLEPPHTRHSHPTLPPHTTYIHPTAAPHTTAQILTTVKIRYVDVLAIFMNSYHAKLEVSGNSCS